MPKPTFQLYPDTVAFFERRTQIHGRPDDGPSVANIFAGAISAIQNFGIKNFVTCEIGEYFRRTMYVPHEKMPFLAEHFGGSESIQWTLAINTIIPTVDRFIKTHTPRLERDEWAMVLETYSGTINNYRPQIRIASDIMAHYDIIDLADFNQREQSIIKKLHGLSQAEQYCVLDIITQYHARSNGLLLPDFIESCLKSHGYDRQETVSDI